MAILYTKEHLWINTEEGTIGITNYAQEELGDILFVDLPEEGDKLGLGDKFVELETSKTNIELIMPFEGTVIAANEELDDDPEKINEDAMASWIVKFEMSTQPEDAMSEDEYKAFVETL